MEGYRLGPPPSLGFIKFGPTTDSTEIKPITFFSSPRKVTVLSSPLFSSPRKVLSSPRKQPASEVPGAQGHVDAVRSSLNTLFSGVVSSHAPESVRAPMSANPAGLRSHWAPVESQAEVNRRLDPLWVDSLVSLIAEEFLPFELVKSSFRE